MRVTWNHAVAATAQGMAEPARVRMLGLLLDGSARTATELALAAGVTPSTASTHLQRLESAGLVTRPSRASTAISGLPAPMPPARWKPSAC